MDKEMLDILNDLSKKPTTELALKIMELSSENLILEQQCKKQKEVIDKAIEYIEQKPVVMVNGEPREIYVEDDNKLLEILKGDSNE